MLEKSKVSEINVVNPIIKEPVRSWFNVSLMSVSHFMSDFYTAFLPVLLPILAARYKDSGEKPLGLPSGWKPQIIHIWVSFGKLSYV